MLGLLVSLNRAYVSVSVCNVAGLHFALWWVHDLSRLDAAYKPMAAEDRVT